MEGPTVIRRIFRENGKVDNKSSRMAKSMNDWWIDEEEEELDDLINDIRKNKRMVNQKRSNR